MSALIQGSTPVCPYRSGYDRESDRDPLSGPDRNGFHTHLNGTTEWVRSGRDVSWHLGYDSPPVSPHVTFRCLV